MHRLQAKNPDYILLFVAVVILAIGLVMVLSASSVFAYNETDNSYSLFYKQLRLAAAGFFTALIAMYFPYKYWKKVSGVGIIITIVLLLLVNYSDFSVTIKGATRWLNIFGVTFQPSEIAKLSLIIFLAHIFNHYRVKRFSDMFFPLIILGIIVYLIYKQPDLGTAIVIILTGAAMFLMTEISLGYFIIGAPAAGFIGYLLIRDNQYQWNRILGWLYPWEHATTHGYQTVNAQIAFGTGGLFGIGIGRSTESLSYLPENYTDTIFAVIGQEFGFFGSSIILACYVLLIGRGYVISRQSPDNFGRLLGFGITSALAVQVVINLCVVTGLSPVTGITLPLISYGGSSLVITMAQLGILLNISRYREPYKTE